MRSLVSDLIGVGFKTIGDLAEQDCELLRYPDSEYDPSTGTVTPGTPDSYPIEQVIETRFTATELNGDVDLKTDARFIIHAPQLTVTPEEEDVIVYQDGTRWNVKKILSVPGKSVWILHMTKA